MKWLALAVFIIWTVIYFFGGWNSPKIVLADPHQGPGLYLLGLVIVALYAPLYWWRRAQDRRRGATGTPAAAVVGAAGPAAGAGGTADGGSASAPGGGAGAAPVSEPASGPEPSGEPPVVR
jgi:hypothetical protein